MRKAVLLLSIFCMMSTIWAGAKGEFVSRALKKNPFGVLQISPFGGPDELNKRYAEIMEQVIPESKSNQKRKEMRDQTISAYKQLQKPEDWRLTMYYLLVNGAEKRNPHFYGLDSDISDVLVNYLLWARELLASKSTSDLLKIDSFLDKLASSLKKVAEPFSKTMETLLRNWVGEGAQLSKPKSNIIDSNNQIEKEYEIAKRRAEEIREVSKKNKLLSDLEQAYTVLTQPWRLKEFINPIVAADFEKNDEPVEVSSNEPIKNREQVDLMEKAQEKRDQEARLKREKEQEEAQRAQEARAKKEELRKKNEQEAKDKAAAEKEAERIKNEKEQEERARREAQEKLKRHREEIDRETAQAERAAEKKNWKSPVLTFSTVFPAPEKMANKFTFELKNKFSEGSLAITLLENGDAKKNITEPYKGEAVVASSAGKEESEHGYLRIAGLDPRERYQLIIDVMFKRFVYDVASNYDRRHILLKFEKKGNDFVVRPQEGALFSSESQSGIPLEKNIKESEIKLIKGPL